MVFDRRKFLLAGATALVAASFGLPVQAQVAVYDAAAVAQALRQVSQGLQQIQALKDQLTQQAQMIARLGVDVTGPLGQIVSEATGLLQQAQGLGYQAADLTKAFTAMYPDDLSKMSASNIAARLAAWSQASRQTLQEAMQVQSQIAQAKTDIDATRKATAQLAFWLTASLLLGAFCASLAATEGGGLRDGTWGIKTRR